MPVTDNLQRVRQKSGKLVTFSDLLGDFATRNRREIQVMPLLRGNGTVVRMSQYTNYNEPAITRVGEMTLESSELALIDGVVKAQITLTYEPTFDGSAVSEDDLMRGAEEVLSQALGDMYNDSRYLAGFHDGREFTESLYAYRVANLEPHQLENSDQVVWTHRKERCRSNPCPIHNLTDHPLRSMGQVFWEKHQTMARVCEHGQEHTDPDESFILSYENGGSQDYQHDCDGCCDGGYASTN